VKCDGSCSVTCTDKAKCTVDCAGKAATSCPDGSLACGGC
jgi:hypothetical protein